MYVAVMMVAVRLSVAMYLQASRFVIYNSRHLRWYRSASIRYIVYLVDMSSLFFL
jgi:hypothetical protein